MKILIVNDEPDVRDLLVKTLAYAQPELTSVEARNGEEALRVAESERPDLMLLDLILPRKDGSPSSRSSAARATCQ